MLRNLSGRKTFISCSSGDVEFNALLREMARLDPHLETEALGTLNAKLPGQLLEVSVVRGGFPANFDRTNESVPSVDIQLTRGLLLGAVLQASQHPARLPMEASRQMLSPFVQCFVIKEWTRHRRVDREMFKLSGLLSQRSAVDQIRKESGGNDPGPTEFDAILWPDANSALL
jgi:hypothetical protein